MKKYLLILFIIPLITFAQNKFTLSGYVKEKGSLEQLIGVNVIVKGKSIGTSTNTYGFYSLTLPQNDSLTMIFSMVGFEQQEKLLCLTKNIDLTVELSNLSMEELHVSAKRQSDRVSDNVQMSTIDLPISQIKKIPTLLGEKDVLRVLQLMPGVQKGSEGQTGIYVRGGGPDQNLIILDDANVYNANHLFGFFSVFNGDALKSVELTKGGFPARYGGRLSSVIDLNMKEGNKEKFTGEGGIGLISSRLTLEGPIKKNKSSFLISARRTYLDILAKPFISAAQKGESSKGSGAYFFYDLNAKLNFDLNPKNKIYLSGYFGKDVFKVNDKGDNFEMRNGLNWGNATATLRWNHLFTNKLFSNLSMIFTDYNFNIYSREKSKFSTDQQVFNLNYKSAIRDYGLKYDFDFFPNPNHNAKIGIQGTFHLFDPSAIVIEEGTDVVNRIQKPIQALEAGIYGEDTWSIGARYKVNYGIRLSNYQVIGRTIWRPEPRIAMSYKIANDFSAKASYAQMNQYIHLLANTGLGLPTDLWVPSTKLVDPQNSEQVAVGLAKDLQKQGISITLEAYYKKMNNILNYKEGSSFVFFDDPAAAVSTPSWEQNVTAGTGTSYGTELLIQKKYGKFSGWIGYTLSKTKWQFDDLNFGKSFYPKYDRRHDISVVGIYDLNKRISISGTWVYGTGNALTIPIGTYKSSTHFGNGNVVTTINGKPSYQPILGEVLFNPYNNVQEFGEKNSFRAEPYHRLDLSIQLHKKKKSHERTWEFSLYNAYNRRNPFFYAISEKYNSKSMTRTVGLTRYSVFPIVPSFSYNFKF
jgi:hypothetical protein